MFYLKGAYLNNQPRRNSLSFNKVEKAGRELHPDYTKHRLFNQVGFGENWRHNKRLGV